ncbi:MAG: hypothetical protein J2P58_08815 [Acidimicrobiaceae bacterium]|nr:hypothetical protein [Acidimicrobiaceae bacterium]
MTHYSAAANKGKKFTKAQAKDLQGVVMELRGAYPHSELGRSVGRTAKVSDKSPKVTPPPTPAPPPPTTVYVPPPPPTTVYVPPPPPTTAYFPPPTTAPTATSPTASCSPLSNEGTCYEPGEFCRESDHGMTGIAGDGDQIACEDNDGWRWEPTG